MTNIEIKNLNFSYADRLIFDKANINIDDSWHLGLVGRNGRGKTTLLKLLSGKLEGSSPIKTAKKFVYFPQEITDSEQLTIYALQELAGFEDWQLKRELTLLDTDLDVLWRPFRSLSGGEQSKCLLAILFLDKDNFPLIDEPTNHLDLASRLKVANYLKKKSGFILVSHDRDFLNRSVDHVLAIEREKIQLYQGNFSMYETEKKLRDDFEYIENEKLKRDILRLQKTAREKESWSRKLEASKSRKKRGFDTETKRVDKGYIGAKATSMMQKSMNLQKRMKQEIVDKEKLLKNLEITEQLKMNFKSDFHKSFIRFENFSLGYERPLFREFSAELKAGEILVIKGENGIGKSSLINYLFGKFDGKIFGKAEVQSGIQISYVRQFYENKGFLTDFAEKENLDYEQFLSNLKKLGLERETFHLPIEQMSQGQQKKVEVAKALSQTAQLYIWDEVLNYLDVFNQQQTTELLKSVKAPMLIVEHDQAFMDEVATKIVELRKI
ncbi:MAG: ATP-binding cassette domain-containing protein [Streptococcaceae bacterium]|jgi:lincosamide and streptogramin A transport system ATP-binding/permease protein|nr:ATP-binding cassette domain-containing protein [Streptococcaceae bacterium]